MIEETAGRPPLHWAALAAAGPIVAGGDLLAHRVTGPARPAIRYGTALAVLALAGSAGVPAAGLGLGRAELGRGARTGALAGACAWAMIAAATAMPASRRFLADERARPGDEPGRLAADLARITLLAVPAEELTYRAGLLGLLLPGRPAAGPLAWSSLIFGASHIMPTLATMHQSALHPHLAGRRARQAAFVAGNVLVTSVAGAAFGWLRLRSGSVLAPVLAHAAINDGALIAGRIAHGLAAR